MSCTSHIPSSACSSCGESDEFLEHLFPSCHNTKNFWAEVIKWLVDHKVKTENLQTKTYCVWYCKWGLDICESSYSYWQNNTYTLVDRTNILPPLEFSIPKLILFSYSRQWSLSQRICSKPRRVVGSKPIWGSNFLCPLMVDSLHLPLFPL